MSGPGRNESTGLLERALGYALCSVRTVTPALLSRETPCRGWDLAMLLRHANESLAALHEGVDTGYVDLVPGAESAEHRQDPAEAFRVRASGLLGAWAGAGTDGGGGTGGPGGHGGPDGHGGGGGGGGRRDLIAVADWPLTAAVVARAGALEIAVHGWDIARAAGPPRPIPPALAVELLHTARHLVPEPGCRHPLFAPPVAVPPQADPGDRLVAFLGRDPAFPNGA